MLVNAARSLLRQPAFALAAAGTLALGIAAPVALFSAVNAVLLRPLPYPRAQDIYTVRTYFPDGRFTSGLVGSEELGTLGQFRDAIARTTLVARNDGALTNGTDIRQLAAYSVTDGFFDLFGVPMALGRSFTSTDHARGAPTSLVISHGLWQSAFGGRPDVVGQPVRFNGHPMRIVGVAPERFDIPAGTDVWLPGWAAWSVGHVWEGYIRLQPGVTPESLAARMTQVMQALGKKYPDQDNGRAFQLRPLLDATVGDLGPILIILFGATALLLVLAAANVTNLMLARGTGRVREMAVRAALGASRRRILLQLVIESMLLSIAGGIGGLAAAYSGIRILIRLGGSHLPRLDAVPFDANVAVFIASIVVATGVLVGIVPALRLADGDIAPLMNEGGRTVRGSLRTRRLLAVFVVAEIAVAVALVAGAVRLVRSYEHLQAIDPGFDPRGRLVLDVRLPSADFEHGGRRDEWWPATVDALRAAGATRVAAASSLPLQHEWDTTVFADIVSRPDIPPDQRPNGRLRLITPDFLSTMGIRLVAGRPFDDHDRYGVQPVAIVNEAYVRRFMPDADPLRERLSGFNYKVVGNRAVLQQVAIVGVAADVRYSSLTAAAEPTIYVPFAQYSGWLRRSIVVTSADGHPERLAARFTSAVRDVQPELAVDVSTMSAAVSSSLERQRLGTWLMSGFGAAALLLALVGVFGVVTYVAAQRTGEMAIRQALGATRAQIFWMVVRSGARSAVSGLAIGLLIAWWTGRLIARYVYDASPADPFVLSLGAVVVGAIALCATLLPARRAAQLDPARTLRG